MMNDATQLLAAEAERKTETARPWLRYVYPAITALVIIFFALIRYRLRAFPLERDEGEYAYAGQLMLHGIAPYKLAYNMKLPGTYLAYAAILAVFGQTPSGVHLGLIVVNALASIILYRLTARLLSPLAASAAAASYAVLSLKLGVLGMAAHSSHFVVLPALAGLLILLVYANDGKRWRLAASGLLLGLAFLMKQPGLFFGIFGLAYLLYIEWLRKPVDRRRILSSAVIMSSTMATPFALTCLWLYFAGVFGRFWFWTWTYAREYGSYFSLAEGLANLRLNLSNASHNCGVLWLLAGAGLVAVVLDRNRARAVFIVGFLLAGCVALSTGLYFRPHYFIFVLPAVALLAGAAVESAKTLLLRFSGPKMALAFAALLFAVSFGDAVFESRVFFFEVDPLQACRMIYQGNLFEYAPEVATYIERHTKPDERIAVIGSEPEIYFYSHRLSATGYIYTYGLTEEQPYAAQMQREMIAEIGAARPAYVVLAMSPFSWLPHPHAKREIFEWSNQYLHQHYEVVGVADMAGPPHPLWDDAAKGYALRSRYALVTFKRKD